MSKAQKLYGSPGSPYTRKMLAYMRYRHIPYELMYQDPSASGAMPAPKVRLLPTFYFEDGKGGYDAVTDSTPLIRRFEGDYEGRAAVPSDPALAFLDYVLEDFGDEWLTKAMFHYRWAFAADIDKAKAVLPRWGGGISISAEQADQLGEIFGDRQISRLWVVGSNDVTGPVIEESYHRILKAMDDHLGRYPYLMGNRPGASDFAFYAQLTQLAQFDPTSMAVTLKESPRVFAWVHIMDDLSGLQPSDDDWISREDAAESLGPLLEELGKTYVPVMLANAETVMSGADKVECEVEGKPWVQKPFPYQAKCVKWIREELAGLSEDDRAAAMTIFQGSGCVPLFKG